MYPAVYTGENLSMNWGQWTLHPVKIRVTM